MESIYNHFLAYSQRKRFSTAEKAEIEEVAQSYGLTLNHNCPDCYRDAALQIALANKPEQTQEVGEFELCDGIDVTLDSYKFGTLKVNAANCTNANARKWIEAGLPLRFFKRLPDDYNE